MPTCAGAVGGHLVDWQCLVFFVAEDFFHPVWGRVCGGHLFGCNDSVRRSFDFWRWFGVLTRGEPRQRVGLFILRLRHPCYDEALEAANKFFCLR